jgi:hypothetical protein
MKNISRNMIHITLSSSNTEETENNHSQDSKRDLKISTKGKRSLGRPLKQSKGSVL